MLKLRSIEEFSTEIERLVAERKLSYMEAILEHLATAGIDVDSAKLKTLISKDIQEKLYAEAEEMNMFAGKK